MKYDTDTDHFDEMTDFLSREAKVHVLDSLACVFHNEGYNLEGNTEHNDVRWLANFICRRMEDRSLEQCSEARQRELMEIAKVAKDANRPHEPRRHRATEAGAELGSVVVQRSARRDGGTT